MQYSSPELLMPAGNFEKMTFAFAYGADAVYAGVPIYSLRARENGFSKKSITEAIDYAHRLGKRIYLTMNVYAHNSKINGFLDNFCEMADLNPDGFIMSDVGLIAKARKLRPDTVIHLSTQANATNWAAVEFWRDLGIRRIILSRELSLKEIAVIREKVPDIELEAFVHGAICISHSGRCLISNYLNHRDANQGTCTNSCRWEYRLAHKKESLLAVEAQQQLSASETSRIEGDYFVKEPKRPTELFPIDEDEHGTYLMNSKDLCAIEILKEIVEAGVCSLKVEGRSKSIYYNAVIARAYRQAIDDLSAGKDFRPELLREVMSTSSRTLMTGFFLRRPQHYGQNLEDGDSLPLSHRFAGVVRQAQDMGQGVLVEAKNKLVRGDVVEWLTPQETVTAPIESIYDAEGTELQTVSGGALCRLKPPCSVDCFSLLRSPLPEREPISQ